MATQKELINEGEDYKAILSTNRDTTSYTIEVFAYDKLNPDTENNIGSVSGKGENEKFEIMLNTSSLSNGTYIIEIWAILDGNKKFLIYPNEKDEFIVEVKNREGV